MDESLPPSSGRGPLRRLEPIGGLGTMLVALLTIMAIASVVVAAMLLDRAAVLGDADATQLGVADAVDRGTRAKRIYELGVLATGVAWITWQVRYVRNVAALGRPTGFEPGWAIGGWLVPGVNLVIPQWQLAVSAKSSDPGGSPSTPRVLYAWWAACVATIALLAIGTVVRPPEHEFAPSRFSDFATADRLHSLCMAAAFVASVLGILTVITCTQRQEKLLAHYVDVRSPSASRQSARSATP